MSDSESESSDSSNEFLVPADQIDLNSSFFNETIVSKPNLKNAGNISESSDSDEDELEDFHPEDVDNVQSAELFSKILQNLESHKNLENSRNQEEDSKNDDLKGESSKSELLSNEINQLLLQGESGVSSFSLGDRDEEEEKPETSSAYTIPKEGVQIILPRTHEFLERKKNKKDVETLLKNKINQRIRSTQVLIHKVGLLWWLVYGFHLNRLANDPEILATCLSLITKNDYPKGRVDLVYLQRITNWFSKTFPMNPNQEQKILTVDFLLERVREKKIYDYRELVIIFVALLRAIGLNCRLVVSLCPPHLKPKRDQLFQTKKEEEAKAEKVKTEKKKNPSKKKKEEKKEKKDSESKKIVPKNSPEGEKKAQMEARKKAAEILKKGKNSSQESEPKKSTSFKEEKQTIAMKLRKRNDKEIQIKHIEMDLDDSDEDFVPKKIKKTSSVEKVGQKNRKLISSEEESESDNKNCQDIWAEVYVESEGSWISVSIPTGKIHCVKEIYKKASSPVLYIIAYNSGGSVKDVTRRYCPQWLTVTRKQRVDENWWNESLTPWKEKDTPLSKAEDEMLLQRELEQPLPKTVGECKGHPLYALARHLLKFEALYPPDCVPLGYLKNGEAIYSRHCVHTLRSRETWVKHARVVKPAQEAYKVVTAMPKYDKFSGTKIKGLPLDLFGKWQTTPYVPPVAKDGIVPRNEYGNVDLFKKSMLPVGTVHIDLPGLSRIAKKLDIDCAPAVVGFDFRGIGAVPSFEGFVVCSEFEDTLREAWEAEQIEIARRAREKREKRIYGNWRKLIKGLLIRIKLAAKYSTENPTEETDEDEDEDEDEEEEEESEDEPVIKKPPKKGKKKELEEKFEKPTKKQRVKKEPPKKDIPSTSKRPTRKNLTRKNYQEKNDEENSDEDFEVKKPKKR